MRKRDNAPRQSGRSGVAVNCAITEKFAAVVKAGIQTEPLLRLAEPSEDLADCIHRINVDGRNPQITTRNPQPTLRSPRKQLAQSTLPETTTGLDVIAKP